MVQARLVLVNMFNHFEEGSAVKNHLQSNCMHLLDIPTGDTGVLQSYFDSANWTPSNKYTLPSNLDGNVSRLFNLPGSTGVYTIQSTPSGEFCIGSTTNFDARFSNHYSDSTDPNLASRLLYSEVTRVGGFNHFI